MDAFDDIRNQLRRDHESALAELDALRGEADDRRCRFLLQRVRRAWMIHALAEEAVVYRALEGALPPPPAQSGPTSASSSMSWSKASSTRWGHAARARVNGTPG